MGKTVALARCAAYGLRYVFAHWCLGTTMPLIRGLVLTNRCNLRCRHCRLGDHGEKDLDFSEVRAAIDDYYEEGGRCLYLEGGEPFIWQDGPKGIEDIVRYARQRGYLTVVVYTNGTLPIQTSADTVFVSVDGLQSTHDSLRGKSFDRIMGNIRESTHPSIFINYTINQCNKDDVRGFCEYIHPMQNIRGTFFYFHTPYYGYDELFLPPEERERMLHTLLELRQKYRILNSRAGLHAVLRNDWKRPMGNCSVYEKGTIYNCCRYPNDPELCRQCGYLSYAEIDQTLQLKPSAICNALKYF